MSEPSLDLSFERWVDIPPALVWAAWTEPEHLKQWFTPAPWTTTDCAIDLRPGGLFHTVMRSPEGASHQNFGCYLEVVPTARLVWTTAMRAGFRPAPPPEQGGFQMTAALEFLPEGSGTRYRARALHADPAAKPQHEAMGFQDGWGKALDQLVAHMKSL